MKELNWRPATEPPKESIECAVFTRLIIKDEVYCHIYETYYSPKYKIFGGKDGWFDKEPEKIESSREAWSDVIAWMPMEEYEEYLRSVAEELKKEGKADDIH